MPLGGGVYIGEGSMSVMDRKIRQEEMKNYLSSLVTKVVSPVIQVNELANISKKLNAMEREVMDMRAASQNENEIEQIKGIRERINRYKQYLSSLQKDIQNYKESLAQPKTASNNTNVTHLTTDSMGTRSSIENCGSDVFQQYIAPHLNVKDRANMSRVSKSWRNVSNHCPIPNQSVISLTKKIYLRISMFSSPTLAEIKQARNIAITYSKGDKSKEAMATARYLDAIIKRRKP